MFKGVYTAMLTPFKYGEVDTEAFKNMLEWQIESGIDGVIIAGSTGEGQSLVESEYLNLLESAVSVANGRIKVIANTGLISSFQTAELTNKSHEIGADAAMIIAPFYVRPTQEGLYQHYKTIHELTKLPIIIYNNPVRTGVDISNDTIVKLSELSRILALKDCSGDISRCAKIRARANPNFNVLCGDDSLMLPLYSQGAVGLISTVGNIIPSLMLKLHKLWFESNVSDAIYLQDILLPLISALSCETNPIGYKYAASQFELCLPDVRLPLVQLSEANKKLVREALQVFKTKLYESD